MTTGGDDGGVERSVVGPQQGVHPGRVEEEFLVQRRAEEVRHVSRAHAHAAPLPVDHAHRRTEAPSIEIVAVVDNGGDGAVFIKAAAAVAVVGVGSIINFFFLLHVQVVYFEVAVDERERSEARESVVERLPSALLTARPCRPCRRRRRRRRRRYLRDF